MPSLVTADGSTGLHEREASLSAIEETLVSAAAGRGAVLGLVGEAGLGKTTLLELAGSRARECGFRVGSARGESAESSLPFGLLQQAATSLGTPSIACCVPAVTGAP